MNLDELVHYLRLGGVTLAVILICSIISLFVAVERTMALWNFGEGARALGETIAKYLLRGDLAAARSAAERSQAPSANLYRVGFERMDRPGLEPAVDRERAQINMRMRKGLWVLGTIGATTPFVGLFGTVAGIMRSFKDLGLDAAGGGQGGPATVMLGISEALIATAAGILVAVVAVVLYNYFQSRVARLTTELRLLGEEFIELLRERPPAPLGGGAGPSASSTHPTVESA